MYQRILVGTDGSSTAARAVARAAEVAATTGASLTVVTAGSGPRAERVVSEAVEGLGGLPLQTKVLAGDPADALVEEAARGYDLLVVGNKGMAGISRFLLGSVPNKVSHHTPCPLLIVHTTG